MEEIVHILIDNITQRVSYEWDNIDGWLTPLPEAIVGNYIEVYVSIQNQGDVEQILFAEFVSAQVSPDNLIQEGLIPPGEPTPSNWPFLDANWTFTMPPNDVNITINAGHVI